MKTITQKIRDAYAKSWDKVDRTGVGKLSSLLFGEKDWTQKAAKEHDQAAIRYRAGVTDETPEEIDENLRKNLEFDAGKSWFMQREAWLLGGIATAAGWFIWH